MTGSISIKTLAERLSLLEAKRRYKPTGPRQIAYALTDKMLKLDGVTVRIAELRMGA